jgi:hypothetical protein
MTIYVNGEKVVEGYDVFAAAGDANKAVDLTFSHIHPQNGVISIRLVGSRTAGVSHEAMIQALEVSREEGETQVNLGEKLFSGKLDAKP